MIRGVALVCALCQLILCALPAAAAVPRDARFVPGSVEPAERFGLEPLAQKVEPIGAAEPEGGVNWGVLLSGAGLLAGVGLAVYLKSEADERYDQYLDTADPDAARELRDSAERYDRATLIGWGVAQASFLALFYFLTRGDDRDLVPVAGQGDAPIEVLPDAIGIRVRP